MIYITHKVDFNVLFVGRTFGEIEFVCVIHYMHGLCVLCIVLVHHVVRAHLYTRTQAESAILEFGKFTCAYSVGCKGNYMYT